MKKVVNLVIFSAFLLLLTNCNNSSSLVNASGEEDTVQWYTWEEAMKANETEKKKIFVDLYTDWCGWCKRMDKTTFAKPEVARYLNKHFYPVKFDAEQKEDIQFAGQTFKYQKGSRGKGVHMLAYSLVDGKLSYPTVVYLTGNLERIMISPGYKDAKGMLKELKFAGDDHYKTTKWEAFQGK